MAIRPIILESVPITRDVVMISNSGISFSASFIKNKELLTMLSVEFFMDDEDQYKLLFRFYDEEGLPNALALKKQGRGAVSNGRTTRAQSLFSKNRVLSSIQKLDNKSSKIFDIKFDKFNKYYFISLRPSFENFVLKTNSSSLPSNAIGIYRYLDKNGDVIYIGEGVIKERLQSTERKDWEIHKIEYSILNSKDESLKWESFYIGEYTNHFGLLPPFNRISGHSQTNK